MKKLFYVGARVDELTKNRVERAAAKARGIGNVSVLVRATLEALIRQTAAGDVFAQPVRLLTEREKVILIRSGYDFPE